MAKTLLEIVQDILSSMDSDEVNSITDTVESEQVARIVRNTYEDLISRVDYPEHWDMFELNASGTSTKPTLMYKPTNIKKIDFVKYDKRLTGETAPNYQYVAYQDRKTFLDRMYALNVDEDDVISFDHTISSDTMTLLCFNNKAPDYYTSLDDNMLIFDSYDAVVDANLQKNKTMCYGLKIPTPFSMTDGFTPDLDEEQFALLFQESKATAFADLKQTTNARAERSARQQWIKTQENFSNPIRRPYYGRK